MSGTPPNTLRESTGSHGPPPAPLHQTRPLYWSIRREVWEHRSVYVAPIVVAALALFGSLISLFWLPGRVRDRSGTDPDALFAAVADPLTTGPGMIMFTTFLVGIVYSLDALYGERRDRSILFWKSLPVSDRTTVISKAFIPLVILPLFGLLLSIITFIPPFILSSFVVLAAGENPAVMWGGLFFQQMFVMGYGLAAHSLWYAPIYSWLLLISAWARRMPLLWAVLPPVVLVAFERMISGTSLFGLLMRHRFGGAMELAFAVDPKESFIYRFSQLDPAGFLASPGLWFGLVVAALFLARTIRLRRQREPI